MDRNENSMFWKSQINNATRVNDAILCFTMVYSIFFCRTYCAQVPYWNNSYNDLYIIVYYVLWVILNTKIFMLLKV